jgi:hypothetical protein
MMKRDLIIAILATFCLTATLFLILPVRSTGTYDPWADFYGTGKINMLDVGYVASLFGTSGDPTRNVTVTNWPTSNDVLVWWNYYLGPSSYAYSSFCDTYGFGHLHVLVYAGSLSSGTVTVNIYGCLSNKTTGMTWLIPCYTAVLTNSNSELALTLDVPSETFRFFIQTGASSSCYIYLSYYLTWS